MSSSSSCSRSTPPRSASPPRTTSGAGFGSSRAACRRRVRRRGAKSSAWRAADASHPTGPRLKSSAKGVLLRRPCLLGSPVRRGRESASRLGSSASRPSSSQKDSRLSRSCPLESLYRTYAWVSPLAADRVQPWDIDGFTGAVTSGRSALKSESPNADLVAPVEELAAAREDGTRASRRVLVIGGQAGRSCLRSSSSRRPRCDGTRSPTGSASRGAARAAGSSASSRERKRSRAPSPAAWSGGFSEALTAALADRAGRTGRGANSRTRRSGRKGSSHSSCSWRRRARCSCWRCALPFSICAEGRSHRWTRPPPARALLP